MGNQKNGKLHLTKEQARQFLLVKHGLLGGHRFSGKKGVLEFIHQVGCVQFDPVDVCGKNAELVLHSRVKGFSKQTLPELLYEARTLVDYFDKNLAIFPVEDWPYFERYREKSRSSEWSLEEIHRVTEEVKRIILEQGPVCSSDLDMPDKVRWYWSDTKVSRAALEHLYFAGELGIHHKKGSVKYYDLIENCISAEILFAPDPFPDDHEHRRWRVLRRIGAVGMLWNRASDAWLNIAGLIAAERKAIFSELEQRGDIAEISVEGISGPLYILQSDLELAEQCLEGRRLKKRCEFIAPLDNLLWDRKLVREIFDFEYKWEIYTPADQRKYGHYVLPILYGESFIGRIEAVADRKNARLDVKNIWYEPSVKVTGRMRGMIDDAVCRLALFHFGNEKN